MNVSRETFYGKILDARKNNIFGGFNLSSLDLLPLVLSKNGATCLVADGDCFESVFSILHKNSFPELVVLTNKDSSSPSGFRTSLDRCKNNLYLLKKDFSGLVLLDSSTFQDDFINVYSNSSSFFVDGRVKYEALLSKLGEAGYSRSPVVSSPGDFAVRGSVIDFYSGGLPHPVRVDFSENIASLYLFNVLSQVTLKKIKHVSFVVSLGGTNKTSLSPLLVGLDTLCYSSGSLVWNKHSSFLDISSCYYEDYRNFDGLVFEDSSLSSFGVFCDNSLFVPSSYLTKTKGVFPESLSQDLSEGQSFSIGDFLIHEDYGVGQLIDILSGDDDDSLLQIAYLDGKISVHLSQINLISFFAKKDTPGVSIASISKKGLWVRKKQSLSNKINLFVASLYDQHLSRMSLTKNRPSVDFTHLSAFVEAFKFKDTHDQSLAFKDIVKDLTSPVPMDRLLCGDVGFGKTELAIRAAFIAANQGSSVVVLCPTTVLCHQLTTSFKDRLSPFSVNVSSVSRLSSGESVNSSILDFKSKAVDVLICTHRIFSHLGSIDDVGLLIVDEEHKFGVKQKNIFLSTYPHIDLLMMSATPIPRTLQSALSGIKTISTITTPPIDRKPIETTVEFFNLNKIQEYIGFELSRGGQVYFLHNNISSLNKFKRQLCSLVSGVRIVVIHAKMSPGKIKEVLGAFVSHKYDILVSTSIIENGLDIPNVNTVIINNAHLFGLSQLHQIRGRVGRHNRQAYAHLLIPKNKQPIGDTYRRLKAIEQNISLGSGYVLSTKDLEIRGAGSVFGYSQSGGAQVGFEYYNKLLQRAVSSNDLNLCFDQIVVDVFEGEAVVPSTYIEDVDVRISIYRKLLSVDNFKSLKMFKDTLSNRFGLVPEPLLLLVLSQEIKILCYGCFVLSVSLSKNICRLVFLPSKLLDDISIFFSGVSVCFEKRNVKYSFQKLANDRLLLSFDWEDKNKDILVFIRDFLNKFKNGFVD